MLGRVAGSLALGVVLATTVKAQGSDLVFAVTEGVTYQATPKEIKDKFAPLAVHGVADDSGQRIAQDAAALDARCRVDAAPTDRDRSACRACSRAASCVCSSMPVFVSLP